ncbi:ergothioneine biosynthesis protein EgtC [Kribbella deserti]|uniref:Gamma-glutamyl-hercynylcysteine sulfoxide hydrolase n=1 Tax=Kribbella deserti TaxID=1926257 RepID=A0ABV6QQH0_9ACTN
MCRHLAYLGPIVPLAELVLDSPHSLYRQSWAPADMRGGGTVNADGFGIGWYDATGAAVRYRRDVPIWADENLPGLAASIQTGAVLAAVRNGTAGMPPGEAACAPFQDGNWFFSHNGVVRGWPDSIAKLAESLPVTDLIRLDAPTDSALLWALIRHRLRAGTAAPEAVSQVVAEVVALDPWARLNFLLTDGRQIVATSWTHALSVKATVDSVAVSSEPWALADGWEPVPDRSLLVATQTSLAVTPLDLDDSTEGPQ